MRTELITCLNSVGEAKLLWLDVALWWGEVQFYFVMYGYIVLQANLSKLRCFIFMEYKGNWPKNYDTSIIQRANTYYTKVFFTKCCKSKYCLLYKIEKNYYSGLLFSCVWVRLATLVIHKEKIQHIVSLPFAWWQWPPERGIVGSALRRWRWNQTLLPRHLQGKATES